MLRYLELRVTEDTLLYQFVCWTPNAFCFFFCFFEVHQIFVLLARARVPPLVRRAHICILRDVQKEYPICTEKDSLLRAVHKRARAAKTFFGRRFSASHFLRTSSTSPSLYSVYLYTQMIAIQRTSASLVGATTGARSSPATSRKNHRAAAASTVTRRDGMRSHVTSMERRTKNSFRLPAIAMPSPEVNEQMQTMTYNETGKWRENFDLAGWAKEIREVRFSSLEFKRRPFPGW